MPCAVTTSCPHCGLRLVISPKGREQTIEYDVSEWQKRCKRKGLNSPALCLEWQAGQQSAWN
jgi:hypothetical protein